MNLTKRFAALLLVAGLVPWIQCLIQLEQQHDHDNYAMSDEFIAKINSMQSLWKAGRNFDPNVTTMNDVRSLCSAIDEPELDEESFKARYGIVESDKPIFSSVNIPAKFDARKVWPGCNSIGLIRDQGSCGSSMAVSVASAISDRICIASGRNLNVQISAEDLMSCCEDCGSGCEGYSGNGGHGFAWVYYNKKGVSTGGEYNSQIGCKPYSFPHCEHHTNGTYPPCGQAPPTPKCSPECTNPSYPKPYQQDKFYGNGNQNIWLQKEKIQEGIQTYGSVTAVFAVYEDFFHYKSGVYFHTAGKYTGRLFVRIIGWGEENDIPYWLVTNSWNEHWGDKGIVKFRRGNNECDIEYLVFAGYPKN